MATSHGIVTQDAPTAAPTQNQDYTKTSLGSIVGALIVATEDTPVNTNFSDVMFHVGSTDLGASNEQMIGCNYEDAQSTTDVKTLLSTTRLLSISNPGVDAEQEGCDFSATTTDGFTAAWTATSTAIAQSAVLFKEGIASFDAQIAIFNGTGSTTVSCGFQPELLICVSSGQTAVTYGPNDFDHGIQFYDQPTDTYSGFFVSANHGTTTPDSAQTHTSAALGGNLATTAVLNDEYTVGTFQSDGFDATKVAQTNAQANMIIAMALEAGYSAKVGTFAAPTSTGVTSVITGLSFTPQIALFAATASTSTNSPSNGASWSFGACDADAEFCAGGWIEHAGATTQNSNAGGHHRSDSCIYVQDNDGTLAVLSQAAFSAFQSDGVDLNFSTADTAIQVSYLVIGVDAGAGGSRTDASGRGLGRGISRGIG